jgi:hypothetical protein
MIAEWAGTGVQIGGYMEEHRVIFQRLDHCKDSMFTLLCIRRFRESVLSIFPRDIVVMFAKYLWKTNQEECWDYSGESAEKKIKKY